MATEKNANKYVLKQMTDEMRVLLYVSIISVTFHSDFGFTQI